jgi:hypothetical protein
MTAIVDVKSTNEYTLNTGFNTPDGEVVIRGLSKEACEWLAECINTAESARRAVFDVFVGKRDG